jgi:hypothetical protein
MLVEEQAAMEYTRLELLFRLAFRLLLGWLSHLQLPALS